MLLYINKGIFEFKKLKKKSVQIIQCAILIYAQAVLPQGSTISLEKIIILVQDAFCYKFLFLFFDYNQKDRPYPLIANFTN